MHKFKVCDRGREKLSLFPPLDFLLSFCLLSLILMLLVIRFFKMLNGISFEAILLNWEGRKYYYYCTHPRFWKAAGISVRRSLYFFVFTVQPFFSFSVSLPVVTHSREWPLRKKREYLRDCDFVDKSVTGCRASCGLPSLVFIHDWVAQSRPLCLEHEVTGSSAHLRLSSLE